MSLRPAEYRAQQCRRSSGALPHYLRNSSTGPAGPVRARFAGDSRLRLRELPEPLAVQVREEVTHLLAFGVQHRHARDAASQAWVEWEGHHISVGTGGVCRNAHWDDAEYRRVFATLVAHYWAHDAFLTPPILEQMDRLAGVPATLIHGRRDVSGPAVIPWRLHQTWPGSELIIDEGEGPGGKAMVEAWTAANTRHADRIRPVPGPE